MVWDRNHACVNGQEFKTCPKCAGSPRNPCEHCNSKGVVMSPCINCPNALKPVAELKKEYAKLSPEEKERLSREMDKDLEDGNYTWKPKPQDQA